MATYLVTGGAGFIGSNIVARLVQEGQKVRVIDDLSTGKEENISPLLKQIDFIEGSITDATLVKKALSGADYVLHQAAIPSVARSVKDPLRSNDSNVTGTLALLLAVKEAKIKCFVYASSSSIYGNTAALPKREDMPPNPLSPYAVTKLTGEYYTGVFSRLYNISAVSLRYFNVFGPNQDPASEYSAVIPKFAGLMIKGERPLIYGDGTQSRDFTFVENVVNANLLACRNAKDARGTVYNIACCRRYDLLKLVSSINEILGTSIKPVFSDPSPVDVKHSQADITLAQKFLGYKPEIEFKQGLKLTIDWIRSSHRLQTTSRKLKPNTV